MCGEEWLISRLIFMPQNWSFKLLRDLYWSALTLRTGILSGSQLTAHRSASLMRDLGLLYRIRQKTEAITWQSRRGHVSQSENEKFVPTRLCFLDINHGLHVVSDLCDLRDKTKSWNVPVMSGHSITVLLTQPSGNIQTQQQHNSSDWRNRMWRTVFNLYSSETNASTIELRYWVWFDYFTD